MTADYDDDIYLDALQDRQPASGPDEPCSHGCGVHDTGESLLRHEREEHAVCPHCRQEPRGEYSVIHRPDCPRLTTR